MILKHFWPSLNTNYGYNSFPFLQSISAPEKIGAPLRLALRAKIRSGAPTSAPASNPERGAPTSAPAKK